ncbi:unnamed protein product [Acanthoscelides obtectus]|uniref:Transmembrane protein 267 n=1 Tax=Acanthoscelides obtectus TaxID=200917 RepID=A0A9P0JZ58_ACAOB|nr:unnamed protein product [Acanthoscelides obtectus]CAK1654190.1 Transmembrane protein 267 [Acanthoscelides obtectus]
MIKFLKFFNLSAILISLLGLTAVVGDYLVLHTNLDLFQAVFDNATHAIIGGLTWFIFCLRYKNSNTFQNLAEVAVCATISSVIDLDHFVAARSLRLEDATNLKHRPPLHCSTFPLLTCFILLLASYHLEMIELKRSTLILFAAFFTHHVRDGTRRGLWIYPYGSTPPIPYAVYVALICLAPYGLFFLHDLFKIRISGNEIQL